jgi:protein-export membrane protein SecD
MKNLRLQFIGILVLALVCAIVSYPRIVGWYPTLHDKISSIPTKLGLDIAGGVQLEYAADLSAVSADKQAAALEAAEAVIERRVNAFGVAEPLVQKVKSGNQERILVELPGVKDIEAAKNMIKSTPYLDFREVNSQTEIDTILSPVNESQKKNADEVLVKVKAGEDFAALAKQYGSDSTRETGGELGFALATTNSNPTYVEAFQKVVFDTPLKDGEIYPNLVETDYGWHIVKKVAEKGTGDTREVNVAHILIPKVTVDMAPGVAWKKTELSGKNLKDAQVQYQSQGLGQPQVGLNFDDEGARLFAELTKRNIGKQIAIFIDNEIVSAPVVNQEILGGQAVITGNFSPAEANALVKRFNEGALPVPITLIGQKSVDATLGQESLEQIIFAGLIGLLAVSIFMIGVYRFLGVVAVGALVVYTVMFVAVIKLSALTPFAITLTLSGIAGIVLSVGMAVDANVLIFERFREELMWGKSLPKALSEAFRRAWPSIRDGHFSALITTFILMNMASGFVKGFAVALTIGILLSLLTAVVFVRISLQYLVGPWFAKHLSVLAAPRRPL